MLHVGPLEEGQRQARGVESLTLEDSESPHGVWKGSQLHDEGASVDPLGPPNLIWSRCFGNQDRQGEF